MRASCIPPIEENTPSTRNSHTCVISPVSLLFFHLPFALKLSSNFRCVSRASERLTVDRVYPPSSTYETIICWWSAFTMRPRRGILDPRFLGRLSPRYMYFELETTLERPAFLPPRPPSSWWRENVRLEDTENEIFSTAVTLSLSLLLRAVFYPPPPFLLSLPTAPSPSIRSPRSAYLREIHRATQSLRRLAKVSLRLSPAGSALLLFAPLFVVRPSPSLPSRAASRRPRTDLWLINEPHPSITSSRIVDGTIGGNGGGNDRYTSKLLFILGEIFIEFYTRLRYDMLFCAYDCEN